MMESMILNSIPTRAEVFDVANAVLDGTTLLCCRQETASGNHPHLVVEAMSRICLGAEEHPAALISRHRLESRFNRSDEAIAMATMYTANHLDIKAIVSPDRVWNHTFVDVAHTIGDPYLRAYPTFRNPTQGNALRGVYLSSLISPNKHVRP